MATTGTSSSDSKEGGSVMSSHEASVDVDAAEKVEGKDDRSPHVQERDSRTVLNGVQLSLKKHKQAFAAYNYSLTSYMEAPVKIDWKVLTSEGVECQHIRYHQLQSEENIANLVGSFKKSHAVAVILVNVEDNTRLPSEFVVEPLPSGKKCSFPVIVISSSDGRMLQEALNHHDPGEINAKIEHKNQPEVKLLQRRLPIRATYSPTSSVRSSSQKKHSLRGSLRLGSRRSMEINLKDMVKQMLLPITGPQCVSEDLALFQHLMSAFYQYEQMIEREREGPKNAGAVFRKLSRHAEEMFERDFPFHITIAYRVHKKQHFYNCDELTPFVLGCIDKFEKLSARIIVDTMETFFKQENFRIMLDPSSMSTVFELMEESCVELMKLSTSVSSQEGGYSVQISHRQLYYRMLWISVAYKCHVERGSRLPVDYWKEHLISKHKLIFLNTDSIQSIRKGLDFGRQLELPDKVAFGSECMAHILGTEGFVRPFHQMREFNVVLEQYVEEEDEFLVNLVRRPRLCYKACFDQTSEDKLKAVHPDGNLLVVLQEGIWFLDSILGISHKRSWHSNLLDEEIKLWLSVLLHLVDILSDHVETYLKDFLTTKSGGVTKQYREHIKREIICKVQENLNKLSVEQFSDLYQAFLIWPVWLVEQYLREYKIPPDVKICNLAWRDLFSDFVERFPDSRHHKLLLDFLQSVGAHYLAQCRANKFIVDLLHLDVPALFISDNDGSTSTMQSDILSGSIADEFTTFLSGYIQCNNLKRAILDTIESIWDSLAEHNEFQQLILTVLQQELIPERSALKGALMTDSSIRFLLESCVTVICKEIGSLQERDISSRLNFCWGILSSCCSRIPFSDTFEWINLFTFIVDQLGRVYGMYCQFHSLNEKDSIMKESKLPKDVLETSCEGVREVFKWVSRAQALLGEWSRKFSSREINYDEIELYRKNFSTITRVASLFYTNIEITDMANLSALKTDFNQEVELLNMFMIRYVPGKPELGWCAIQHVLAVYGIGLPVEVLTALSKYIIFPGETCSEDKLSLNLFSKVPAAISKSFQPGLDVSLQVTRELNLLEIKRLVQAMAGFLAPVKDDIMQMLIYFHLNESCLFDKYLRLQLMQINFISSHDCKPASLLPLTYMEEEEDHELPQGILMENFAKVLRLTKELLLNFITGNASYTDIVADGSPDLNSLNIDHEFKILKEYAELYKVDAEHLEGLIGFKAMLQLFQLTRHIRTIHNVCVQYQLKCCLEDSRLRELVELSNSLEIDENRKTLTTKNAIEKMQVVRDTLCLEDKMDIKYLNLFTAVADSPVFHQFITEKQFVGEDGQALFNQQYQLIITQLQHEEYNEAVLNHLFAAFKLITPFVDREQTFSSLMSQVATLGAVDASKQLDTVNRNINLIRLWFSRAEGDTLEGVENELKYVLETGYYQFFLRLTPEGVQGSVELLYRRSVYTDEGACLQGRSSYMVEQKWNEEQINDFVRKLGFLDAEVETGVKINQFLYLSQTSKKLIVLYIRLKDLGHPDYLKPTLSHNHILPCALSREEADQKVHQVNALLDEWELQIVQLRAHYEQLLFFSIPKLLNLYNLMTSKESQFDGVAKEVGFLFQNKPDVQLKLRETVKELLASKKFRKHHSSTTYSTPIHVVGAFLSELFRNFELSSYSLKKRRPSMPFLRSPSSQSTHILHSCQGYNQSQIVRLIISIYGGVPEPFEVFRCQHNSTKEEITLFLNPKRARKRPFQYLIIEVNKLPYRLQEVILQLLPDMMQLSEDVEVPCIHFIETGPSILREIPYVLHRDYKGQDPALDFSQVMMTCQRSALNAEDFACIKLVFGEAGDGKTHYIEEQLSLSVHPLRITVNESFMPLDVIKKLSSLPIDVKNCAVFFNICLLPPGESVDETDRVKSEQLLEKISWFFFDIFILGYTEDLVTGNSFRFPGGMSWAIYIEVPTRNQRNSKESLEEFREDFPALGMLGTPYQILPDIPYVVNEEVQLVCKYLKAYSSGGSKGIDRLYKEGTSFLTGRKKLGNPVKFSLEADLSEQECRKLLIRYTPKHMLKNKTTQKLFVKYMKRRCEFLDNCPAFNYNTGSSEYMVTEKNQRQKNDTTHLGSTLMHAMLSEVSDFCDPILSENWALKPHHQLIYDFRDGGGTFGLISLHPDQISDEEIAKFRRIGVEIPSMMELFSRGKLDSYLSRALGVPLENGKLQLVDDCAYVLTLDFAIKMLNIHERAECCVPVIIEGETGVGKTALIEMLSKLWNSSVSQMWNAERNKMVDFICKKTNGFSKDQLESYSGSLEAIASLNSGQPLREDELILIGELPDETTESGQFYSLLRLELLKLIGNPVLSLIQLRLEEREAGMKFSRLFAAAEYKNNAKDTAKLLHAFLNAEVKKTFHKLNIHTALQPEDVFNFFEPVFHQAEELMTAYEGQEHLKVPFVTVFLDEINTSSCLGLFKEIMVDRTFTGEPIPDNIFIIGACNPHRGNSLASHNTWIQGSYYVRMLYPTLQCLMWDYGALGEAQERDYIQTKLRMSNQDFCNVDLATLTNLIVTSQNQLRRFALNQMKMQNMTDQESSACSRSCVSQRDIQRVFTFYKWLIDMYEKLALYQQDNRTLRAVLVALGLVYYIRLDSIHRQQYQDVIDHHSSLSGLTFSKVFKEELDWYINHVDLPEGIAKTEALKENLFATIVCTMTHTPLIIVGSPGSSKSLSFSLTIANMKGPESKVGVFRNTDIFKSLDPQVYQCSRRTTSNEIRIVFSRAINRQRSHAKVPLPVYCVVFMDEAGLPEERHESLKALHYYLDSQEVSFVAISNHVLDAAKTNRSVSLFRPEASSEDLVTLAKGCLCSNPDYPPPTIQKDIDIVSRFCAPYEEVMSQLNYKKFFGLRDFIHFISYLRQKRREMLSPQLVMEALERNFNGVEKRQFLWISQLFLQCINSSVDNVKKRNILEVLQSSLEDHPTGDTGENQMRYKLIIDASEDSSVIRLLFTFGVLQRKGTKVYMLSDFPGDANLQKVNTIAAIRHSATEGHTVLMSQTDPIHESFYDLFNHRFHRIDASSGRRFYANIAIGAHIKPCRIHHHFQCIVIVKKSELESIPPPFLNRFEKYLLSHKLLLEAALSRLPPFITRVIHVAKKKALEFVQLLGGRKSVFGYHLDTLSSLILMLLPPTGFVFKREFKGPQIKPSNIELYCLENLLQALRENAGFHIPACSNDELRLDTEEVMKNITKNPEFAGYCSQISCEEIDDAITQGLQTLYYTVPPTKREPQNEGTIAGSLIIQVFCQWLTRHLCKKVLQLTTSEAVCIHQKKFPISYVQSYLNHQHHFCLKSLIESHYDMLNSEKPGCSPSKLICFTRSSEILHQVPSVFSSSLHMNNGPDAAPEKLVEDLFISNTKILQVYKLSSISSYTTIKELLKCFSLSNTHSVLLLIINMQETSKGVINHIRIMIEEVENESSQKKLYVMLLHFPTCAASAACYRAVFLQGWDFYYLDVIGCSSNGCVLDIKDWFQQCYFTHSQLPTESVCVQLNGFLQEAVAAIASRVFLGSDKSSSFNGPMTLLERTTALEEFLLKKGVWDVLIERFNSYWQPNVMVEYLEKAAKFAHQHEATVSIIDSLQSIFKHLFIDFLVYVTAKINEGMNIDVLFDADCTQEVSQLFLDILKVFPIPKLCDLKMFRVVGDSLYLEQSSEMLSSPRFPFFKVVSVAVEKVIDQSLQEINKHVNMLSDQLEPSPSLFQTATMNRRQTMKIMVKKVRSKLQVLSESEDLNCLVVALKALLNHDTLWQKYLTDFTHQKLHLDLASPGVSHKIMLAAFGKLEDQDQFTRLAVLHAYIHVHKLNLARVASILRPLDRIEVTASILLSFSDEIPTSAQSFLHDVEDSGDFLGRPEALSIFIIDTLFKAIAGVTMKNDQVLRESNSELPDTIMDHIKLWFQAYRDVMAMPTLQEHVYRTLSVHAMKAEAQHNLMHIFFLVMRSKPEDNRMIEMGLKIFKHLLKVFFNPTSNMELHKDVPNLNDVTTVVMKVFALPEFRTETYQVEDIFEGLLAHFFCKHQSSYNLQDIRWFLQIANRQFQWQANYLINEVIDAEYFDDMLSKVEFSLDPSIELPFNCWIEWVSMSTFKFYLLQILHNYAYTVEDSTESVMLFFKKNEVHDLVSQELLFGDDLGPPQPYIPTFYQFCGHINECVHAESKLMQQPLAHLYFLTIFEDIQQSNYSLSALCNAAHSIRKQCHGGAVEEKDVLLLHIENQAVVQVMIRELAQHLNLKDDLKVNVVCSLLSEINDLLNEKSMGGGDIGGHSLVLVMHMLRVLQSFQAFSRMLTDHYSLLCDGIHCLEPYHQKLAVSTKGECQINESNCVILDLGRDFRQFYSLVRSCLQAVHASSGNSSKLKEFACLVQESFEDHHHLSINTGTGTSISVTRLSAFKMALWLVIYNDFFLIKKSSPRLKRVLESNLSSKIESPIMRLFSAFLINNSSSDLPPGEEHPDFIYSLLLPSTVGVEDLDAKALRLALVKMIAIVVGSPPKASHLWFHMFQPEDLQNTYITGFLYGTTVGPNTLFYDQGVKMIHDNSFGRHNYLKNNTCQNLSLYSFYLLLWMNFIAFCLHMFIFKNAEENLCGTIFSTNVNIRQFCASQAQDLWIHLRHCLANSNEERALLVDFFLIKHFDLMMKSQTYGRFGTVDELHCYEEQWNASTLMPVSNTLQSQFLQQNRLMDNELFANVRTLNDRYPWLPDENGLVQAVLYNIHMNQQGEDLFGLCQFVLEFNRLKLGSDLLPGILELYQWLHNELAYAVTYEDATKITLGRLAKVVSKRMSGKSGHHTNYESFKAKFNKYVYLTGCSKGKQPSVITDSTPLLHLLSFSMGGEEGRDLLFCALADIITFHNRFLTNLHHHFRTSASSVCYFQKSIPHIDIMEYTQHYGLTWSSESLLQMIHKQSKLPTPYPVDPKYSEANIISSYPGDTRNVINLKKLQDAILRSYIDGKPIIVETSVGALRIAFKFKEKLPLVSLQTNLHDFSMDLETISHRLPCLFKVTLRDNERKQLEYEFHSAGYHSLMEIITGLRTVMGHLMRELPSEVKSTDITAEEKIGHLRAQTLFEFLFQLYRRSIDDEARDVFHEIGIHTLTSTQYSLTAGLHLTKIFQTLRIFVHWTEEGRYDFCSMPFVAKMPMSLPDEDAIMQIQDQYDGTFSELLCDIKIFMDALTHLEGSVSKILPQCSQQSIVKYMKKLQLFNEQDKLISLIPDTIKLEHYVSLRLFIRRLYARVQKLIDQRDMQAPEPKEEWSDYIDQLCNFNFVYSKERAYVNERDTIVDSECSTGSCTKSSEILNELMDFSSDSQHLEGQDPQLIQPSSKSWSHSSETYEGECEMVDALEVAKATSVNKVLEFLIDSKLEQYVDAFEEYEIDGELLIHSSDEELEEIGVCNPIHRLKIRIGFKRFIHKMKSDVALAFPPHTVYKILSSNKQLRQFAQPFAEHNIDGELVLNASDDVMRQLGVCKGVHMRMIRLRFSS